jgi:hypothetical protein
MTNFKILVAAGKNVIIIHPLEKPAVTRLPNGDTRPLLLGVKGLKVGLK